MAKINPLLGKGTGKVGAFLLQVNSGVQILKEKPVKVANPNTDAQAEQRAKLKLMSQLAADLAQTIAFPKKGLVSARNQFISANIGKCTFENNQAKIDINVLDLTGGSGAFPAAIRVGEGMVELQTAAPAGVNAVLYAAYKEDTNGQLTLVDQKINETAGSNNKFQTDLALPEGEVWLVTYGIKNNGSASQISYEDYSVENASDKGVLSYVRAIVVRGGSLTETSWNKETE